ncbi:MAG: hypothetical protein V1909_04555, partial [Candidatus Micrarchaeota archaeon]
RDTWFSDNRPGFVDNGRTLSSQAFNGFFFKLLGLVKSLSKDERQREEDKFGLQISIECIDLANFTFDENSQACESFTSLWEILEDAYSKAK